MGVVGWNVFSIENGNDFDQIVAACKTMEEWSPDDRRPMILIGPTTKGWWPTAEGGKINGHDQIIGYPSHPYAMKMNSEYFVALAESFERTYDIEFEGIRDGVPKTEADRLIQFKTNVDTLMAVMDQRDGLREWIAERLLEIAGTVNRNPSLSIDPTTNPFLDARLKVENLPTERRTWLRRTRTPVRTWSVGYPCFSNRGSRKVPDVQSARSGAWLNYVTDGRLMTMAADLSGVDQHRERQPPWPTTTRSTILVVRGSKLRFRKPATRRR